MAQELARQRWENEGGAVARPAPGPIPPMQCWHLPDVESSTDKLHARAAGSDAPRRRTPGRSKPQVLFSHPECRAVLLDLAAGEQMRDHAVRERVVIEVVSGRASLIVDGAATDCTTGSLICIEPGVHHSVLAREPSRLLLLLAPWNSASHAHEPEHLPRNATATATARARRSV